MKKNVVSVFFLATMAGCSAGVIQQKVMPITLSDKDSQEICLITNPAVLQDILEAYRKSLTSRGLTVKVLPQGSEPGSCSLATTYTANWRWDLALYLAYADLKIYRNNQLEGEAIYDALQAALNTGKFIHADAKIQELTEKLLLK